MLKSLPCFMVLFLFFLLFLFLFIIDYFEIIPLFLKNEITPAWVSAIGTMCLVFIGFIFGLDEVNSRKETRKAGMHLKNPDTNGVGAIVNNSQIIYEIELEKTLLTCECDISSEQSLLDFHKSKNKQIWIKQKLNSSKNEFQTLIPKQNIYPNEELLFHLHHLIVEQTYVSLVLLKYSFNKENYYGVFQYIGSKSPNIHPHYNWVKLYSCKNPSKI